MAYVVGLMATDGCLLSDDRHLNFKSEDPDLVLTFMRCLGMTGSPTEAKTRSGRPVYFAQFSDVAFYDWLLQVGLTPRKSLTLGPLAVPDEHLLDCARGLLDGDGSLLNFWYDGGGKARGRRYETLMTVFNSASQPHLEWLRTGLTRILGIHGALTPQPRTERGTQMWRLGYAIRESSVLLPELYRDDAVPSLQRKRRIWLAYAGRHGLRANEHEVAEGSLRTTWTGVGAVRIIR